MEQMATTCRFKVAAGGFGQGGTSAASTFMQAINGEMKHLFSINLSEADLRGASLVPEANRILLDKNRYGAGRNREISKSYVTEKKDFIIQKVSEILNGEINVCFLFFSTAGGTGSGLGPFLTALLESDAYPKTPANPIMFFGVPLLPDQNEGELSQENTIKALKEISNISNHKAGRFILVDNNVEAATKEDTLKWKSINAEAAKFLARYLFTSYVSKSSNLDPEDRWNALKVPGCHSFCTYNPEICSPVGPFILPEGALVKRMAAEIPEGTAESLSRLSTVVGCQVDEPNMRGFYDTDTEGAWPIVHFAGFSNLNKVTERYQQWFSQIQQKSAAAAKVDATKGVGFSRVKENEKWIDSQSSTNTTSTVADLFSMVNDDNQ